MITTEGEVISNGNGQVWVRCQQKSSCDQCASKQQCGTGLVKSALPERVSDIYVETDQNVPVGSIVIIGFPEKTLIGFAGLVYLLPLLLLLLGAFLGQVIANSFALGEGVVIATTFLFVLLGFMLASNLSKHWGRGRHSLPVLLRVVI